MGLWIFPLVLVIMRCWFCVGCMGGDDVKALKMDRGLVGSFVWLGLG